MDDFVLELFVSGGDPISALAREQAQELCAELAGRVRLVVVETGQDPARARVAEVLVTPTLIRSRPAPERRVVGDLSDRQAVLAALAIGGAGPR